MGPDLNVCDLIPILKIEQEIQQAVAKVIGIENGDLFPVTIFKTKGRKSHMMDLLENDALRLSKKGNIQILLGIE